MAQRNKKTHVNANKITKPKLGFAQQDSPKRPSSKAKQNITKSLQNQTKRSLNHPNSKRLVGQVKGFRAHVAIQFASAGLICFPVSAAMAEMKRRTI